MARARKMQKPDEPEELNASHAISRRRFIATGMAAATSMVAKSDPVLADAGEPIYRIHPAIGVARMGNADPSTFFIGPEIPGAPPLGDSPGTTAPPYKVKGRVKPQGARFRLFEYRIINGLLTPIREVNLQTPGVTSIKWTAHLANRKASFYEFYGPYGETIGPLPLRNGSVTDRNSLESDFGPRTISGKSKPGVEFRLGTGGGYPETAPRKPDNTPVIDYLGQLCTDSAGRLIVIGGQGRADYNTASNPGLPTYANNDNWFDDASDGPVTAEITISGQTYQTGDAGSAWVLCAPPDFAPYVKNAVSLYDLLYDLALRNLPLPASSLYAAGGPLARLTQLQADWSPNDPIEFPNTPADFYSEIEPLLRVGYEYFFVTSLVPFKHANLIDPALADPGLSEYSERQSVFAYMRVPPGAVTNGSGQRSMPKLLGDDPYNGHANDGVRKHHITRTQYGLMRNWSNGFFTTLLPPPLGGITPHGLDRAALENCVGGAFFPGIEASWQIRNPALYAEPFRINLAAVSQYLIADGVIEGTPIRAGHFTRQMAVPWHADFNDCRHEGEYGWWPGQRPDDALVPAVGQRVPWARPDTRFAGHNLDSTHQDMLDNWYKFGFVMPDAAGDALIETERNAPIP